MAKFSAGDRCRAYSSGNVDVGILKELSPGGLWVMALNSGKPDESHVYYHPKQLRKLKPRKPKYCCVPEGYRVISKAELEKAWDSRGPQEFFQCSNYSPGFKILCKVLGFESEGK